MRVAARIFHPRPSASDGPLTDWLRSAAARLAERHAAGLLASGADDVRIVTGPEPGGSFGARLRELAGELAGFDGLVVMGSGALALANVADLRRFVAAAREPGAAFANNRYSADAVAIGGLAPLAATPDLRTDNALPRWLEEAHGYRITDLKHRWRLGVDLDSPIDIVLAGLVAGRRGTPAPADVDLEPVRACLAGANAIANDPAAELLVAGRTSPRVLAELEKRAACRVRALVEERGLRAGMDGSWARSPGHAGATSGAATHGAASRRRPPASVLGGLIDRDGPRSLGRHLAGLADAALVDTRVLLAHRLGSDERRWPRAEDRYASDLLLPDRIEDPWLRELTTSAAEAPIPIVLGGHTLVGPGLRLALRGVNAARPLPAAPAPAAADGSRRDA